VGEIVTLIVASSLRLAAVHWQINAPEPFDLPGWWRRRKSRAGG
jgi:hypothetical protein